MVRISRETQTFERQRYPGYMLLIRNLPLQTPASIVAAIESLLSVKLITLNTKCISAKNIYA